MGSALWTHKADGRPSSTKKWCSKCKKSNHDTLDCWADVTCEYCYKKGHISKVCGLKKAMDKAKERREDAKDTKDKANEKLVFGI
jgi:hypothetical protein